MNSIPSSIAASDDALLYSPVSSQLKVGGNFQYGTDRLVSSPLRSTNCSNNELRLSSGTANNATNRQLPAESSNYSLDLGPLSVKSQDSFNKPSEVSSYKRRFFNSRSGPQTSDLVWQNLPPKSNDRSYQETRKPKAQKTNFFRAKPRQRSHADQQLSISSQFRSNSDLMTHNSVKEYPRKPSVSQVRGEFTTMHVLRLQNQMALEFNAVEKASLAYNNAKQLVENFEHTDQNANFETIQQIQRLKENLEVQKRNNNLFSAEHEDLVSKLDQQGTRLQDLRAEIKETALTIDQVAEMVHMLQREVENQKNILENEKNIAASFPGNIIDEFSQKTTQLDTFTQELSQAMDHLASTEEKKNALETQISELQDKLVNVTSDQSQIESLLAETQEDTIETKNQIETVESKISDLEDANRAKEANIALLENSLDSLQSEFSEVSKELEEKLTEYHQYCFQKQIELDTNMSASHDQIKARYYSALTEYNELLDELAIKERELDEICDKIAELEYRFDENCMASDFGAVDHEKRMAELLASAQSSKTKFYEIESSNQALCNELKTKEDLHRTNELDLKSLNEAVEIVRSQKDQLSSDVKAREEDLAHHISKIVEIDEKITEQAQKFMQKRLDLESEICKMENLIKTVISSEDDTQAGTSHLMMDTQSLFGDPNNAQHQITRSRIEQERQHIRELQYRIQERKGTIRVLARIRPLASRTLEPAKIVAGPYQIDIAAKDSAWRASSYSVSFDKVFGVESTNPEICEEADYILQSTLEGGITSIMAYGQTGSGKTHTMSSPDGVIRYSLEKLLTQTKASDPNAGVVIEAVEIYNDAIRDLLLTPSEPVNLTSRATLSRSVENGPRLQTSSDSKTPPTLVGSTRVRVETTQAALDIFDRAGKNRKFAATAANARSSRSHFIFSMHIQYSQPKIRNRSGTVLSSNGVLHLVDLAGSERLSHSKVVGERLKETNAINSSLSSLGTVINALRNKLVYIPYRDSKLTHFLQGALSANAKTMLITALAPEQTSYEETKSTMRFAERVGKVALN